MTTIKIQFDSSTPSGSRTLVSPALSAVLSGEIFEASGVMIRERNWLDVYRWEKWYASKVPVLNVGEIVVPKRLEMTEGKTMAPPPISESEVNINCFLMLL